MLPNILGQVINIMGSNNRMNLHVIQLFYAERLIKNFKTIENYFWMCSLYWM